MRLTLENLFELAVLAEKAARTAGQMIARSRPEQVTRKIGGASLASQVLTEVDEKSQQIILSILEPTFSEFDLALLTEEREDDQSRLVKDYFWCIDPLDGTLPFVEGVPGYAVSIALVAQDGIPQIGVVFDPVEGNLYSAIKGQGVMKNGSPWMIDRDGNSLMFFMDRSFEADPHFSETVELLEQSAIRQGLSDGLKVIKTRGAVMNALGVLEQSPACYIKRPKPSPGGGSLWDFAATACIFHEAGAVATDFYGDPLDLNRLDSCFMNHRGIRFSCGMDG